MSMKGIKAVLLLWTTVGLVVLGCLYKPLIVLICCTVGVVGLFSYAFYEKYK